jgi:hypothetical protein
MTALLYFFTTFIKSTATLDAPYTDIVSEIIQKLNKASWEVWTNKFNQVALLLCGNFLRYLPCFDAYSAPLFLHTTAFQRQLL